jgi:antirestriction protein ArdC
MTDYEKRLETLQHEVTEKILTDLREFESNGKSPSWVKPWRDNGQNLLPQNLSGRPYSGINVLVLMLTQELEGYPSCKWGTFKSIKDRGGSPYKGEKATPGFFYKSIQIPIRDNTGRYILDKEGQRTVSEVFLLRYYSLFNLSQTTLNNVELAKNSPVQSESIGIDNLVRYTKAKIEFGFDKACYIPRLDLIKMPGIAQFKTNGDYWATLLHELVHWTGYETRLNRLKQFSYPSEELIAELGASFLCAEFGINGSLQHSEYIHHWIKEMEGDYKHIFKVTAQASQAHRMLKEFHSVESGNEDSAA